MAERAGVSLATASRALSGRDGVSEEVASRVRQVSRELGYVANPYARTLAGGASSTVGLVVHQVDDPYFSEIAGGVIQVAAEEGLLVQICHSGMAPYTGTSGTSATSQVFGVEPICRALREHGWQIAASTYRAACRARPRPGPAVTPGSPSRSGGCTRRTTASTGAASQVG
ncbi:LacI family DNA-binding transcriptional regulator [Micromonospora coerulea]|uniref:LacI family DNA-binding transcriptional regulator n=1 Tax=Micromonospora coerulea TaxID=47856 RepID=UPI0027DB4F29|nr:LacI family DNA-binding transcriptional regulator [Micromonospora veneta]